MTYHRERDCQQYCGACHEEAPITCLVWGGLAVCGKCYATYASAVTAAQIRAARMLVAAGVAASRFGGLPLKDPPPTCIGGPCEVAGCDGLAVAFDLTASPPWGVRCAAHVPT